MTTATLPDPELTMTSMRHGEAVTVQFTPTHADHLAHHFDTPMQQFEAAKLGMWLFLATEFLLFGGLFCLYAVLRGNHPELFSYGSQFLQTKWGAINTVVLILSSLTMAWGVRCAQLNQRSGLVICLALTIVGGGVFMSIKYVEYTHKIHDNLIWGINFYELPRNAPVVAAPAPVTASAPIGGDAVKGQALWMATCRTCHGLDGSGMVGQGKDIRGSQFIAGKSDKDLVAFVKVGRMPFDKLNTTGIQMPPRGGNPLLKDDDLMHIVAYIRTFKAPADGGEVPGDATTTASHAALKEEFYIPKSVIPNAPDGPAGLIENWDCPPPKLSSVPPPDPRLDPARPPNLHLFFGMYFMMTGLHGLHVLIGMIVIGWLLVRSLLGHFSSAYFTPVDLVGLYWHVVDVIWIFLFPLLYLIH